MKTKKIIWICLTVLFGFFIILTNSCKKEVKIPVQVQLPILTTSPVTEITSNSATSGGNITSDGGAAVTARGVCWSTNQNPTITSDKTSDGTGTGSFVSSITGLNPGSTFYARAYASNSAGTGYGTQAIIAIGAILPTVTTSAISNVTASTLTCSGDISSDGGASVTSRGVCWSTNQNPTLVDSKTDEGIGTGSFSSNITGLNANTVYHLRAFATNSLGTAYGAELQFSTLYDSISLQYVDCIDTTFINPFPLDSINILVERWIQWFGPHPYECERVKIKSNNSPKIMISFGKIQNYNLYTLGKDSLIDESLQWYDTYTSGGVIWGYIGYSSKYVGLKIVDNGQTYFGWIHTPTWYKMTEYAIDTSSVSNRKIFAGRLKSGPQTGP